MPRNGILTQYDINDCAIFPITSDTTSELVLGAAVDAPGIQQLSVQGSFRSKDLYGDAGVRDTYSRLQAVDFDVRHAQISLPLLELILGATNTQAGSSPTEQLVSALSPVDLPYWRLEAVCSYQGGPLTGGTGDSAVVIDKCKVVGFNIEFQSEEYAIVSFSAKGIPTLYSDRIICFVERESTAAVNLTAYPPRRTILPLWSATTTNAGTIDFTNAVPRRNRWAASADGSYFTWSNVLIGEGDNKLRVSCQESTNGGITTLTIDGATVGTIDHYAASTAEVIEEISWTQASTGFHTVALTTTAAGTGGGYWMAMSDVEILRDDSGEDPSYNVYPAHYPRRIGIPAVMFEASTSDSPTYVTPGSGLFGQTELTADAEELNFLFYVQEGTWQIRAVLGRGADSGIVDFQVDETSITTVDLYAASTTHPTSAEAVGTFTTTTPGEVEVKLLVSGKNASSSGYRMGVCWVELLETARPTEIAFKTEIYDWQLQLLPWFKSSNTNWDNGSYNSSQPTNWFDTSTGVVDAQMDWANTLLQAGTYQVTIYSRTSPDQGIIHVIWDGSDLGQVDSYDSGTSNAQKLTVSITVPTTETSTFSLKMASKNASSSAYYGRISFVHIYRTA